LESPAPAVGNSLVFEVEVAVGGSERAGHASCDIYESHQTAANAGLIVTVRQGSALVADLQT